MDKQSWEYFKQAHSDLTVRMTDAIVVGNMNIVNQCLEESKTLDAAWIQQSGYKVGQKISFQNMQVTIKTIEDVLPKGIIRCLIEFPDGYVDFVGLIPA